MTDQRECANPELNEYLCPTCDHPCDHIADTLFGFAPSTRTRPVHVSSGIAWPALSFLTAYHDLRAAGLVA